MSKSKCAVPCATCPWRVEMDATTIPGYDHEKAIGLMNTVGQGDAMRNIMACHNSTDDNPVACKGYLAREGWSNINVRLLLAKGEIENPTKVEQACVSRGIKLEPSYRHVLNKMAKSIGKRT